MIVIIPGFSSKNAVWAEETKFYFEQKGIKDIYLHRYKHWQTGNSNDFSAYEEAKRIKEKINLQEVSIIAKSIGTRISCILLKDIPFQIQKVIFCGIPLHDLNDEEKSAYEILETTLRFKLTFIQNTNDSHGSLEEVKTFLYTFLPGIEVTSHESDTHEYPYAEEFLRLLRNYDSSTSNN
jgi:predicted alpha/beta-hydrolase family hydrolase